MTQEMSVLERLVACGIDEKDARLLVSLAGQTPMKASDIGRLIGLSRMDAYNTLRRLQDRDLVRATIDKPMRFTTFSIEDIVERLVSQQKHELGRLQKHLDEMRSGEVVPLLQLEVLSEEEATFTVVKGRNAIHSTMRRMFEDAEQTIWCLLGRFGVLPIVRNGEVEVLNEAAKRGVQIRILANIERRTLGYYDELDDRIEIRHSEMSNVQAFLIDDEVALQLVVNDPNPFGRGREEAALTIEANGYIMAQSELAANAWATAVSLNSMRSRIREGRITEPLQVNLGTGSFYQRLRDSLKKNLTEELIEKPGTTNASLRIGNQPLTYNDPALPQLEALGIDTNEIFRTIGRRIGEEILLDQEIPDDEIGFQEVLARTWRELEMGEIEFEGNPVRSVRVVDSSSCGGQPKSGAAFCHLDEGILEGLLRVHYGIGVTAIERECLSSGENHCHFEIQFDEQVSELQILD